MPVITFSSLRGPKAREWLVKAIGADAKGRCAMHPTSGMKNGRSWDFATAAYAICCGISTLCVWLGWELGYEFWRRWRLRASFTYLGYYAD